MGKCVFEYTQDWLLNGFSISPVELPLEGRLFTARDEGPSGNFGVFNDSLPDGYGLFLINRMLKAEGSSLSELDQMQLMSIVGSSGMGALEYFPRTDILNKNDMEDVADFDMLQQKAWAVLDRKSVV